MWHNNNKLEIRIKIIRSPVKYHYERRRNNGVSGRKDRRCFWREIRISIS
jgi:hypothetical protein